MTTYVQRVQWSSGRGLTLAIVIGLHVLLIAGLMVWRIAETVVEVPNVSLTVTSLDEQRPQRKEMTPVKVTLEEFAPIEQPVEVQPIEIEETTAIEPPASADTGADPGAVSTSTDTPLRYRAVRPADDYYPPNAIRLEQAGDVILRTCVDAQGRLSGKPTVVRGRTDLLDAAAVKWAQEALRFTPATRGGVKVDACKDFKVQFTLR